MTTDFRVLCAELVEELDEWIEGYLINDPPDEFVATAQGKIDRTRAALAAEPEGGPESPAVGLAVRPLLEMVMSIGITTTLRQIQIIQDRIAGWLEANPPGQPVAIEPPGCPMPGACSCVEVESLNA